MKVTAASGHRKQLQTIAHILLRHRSSLASGIIIVHIYVNIHHQPVFLFGEVWSLGHHKETQNLRENYHYRQTKRGRSSQI